MRDRGDAVDDPGGEQHRERIERRVGQRDPPQRLEQDEARRPPRPRARSPISPQELPRRRRRHAASGDVASSIIPIISAIPTGSLKPDSPFEDRARAALDLLAGEHRERHRRDRSGASAAPIRSATVQSNPSSVVRGDARRAARCRTCRARRAIVIGTAAAGTVARPMLMPPSKRITISASVATRWTSSNESSVASRSESVGGDGGDDEEQRRRRERRSGRRATRTTIASDERRRRRRRMMRPKSRMSSTRADSRLLRATAARERSGQPLTDSLPVSHCRLIPTTDTCCSYAPRGSDPARPRPAPPRVATRRCEAHRAARSRSRTGAAWSRSPARACSSGGSEKGSLEIVDLNPDDQWSPRVNGIPRGRRWSAPRQERLASTCPAAATGSSRAGRTSRSRRAGRARSCSTAIPTRSATTGSYALGDAAGRAAARRDDARCPFGTGDASRAVGPIRQDPAMTAPQTILVVEDETVDRLVRRALSEERRLRRQGGRDRRRGAQRRSPPRCRR